MTPFQVILDSCEGQITHDICGGYLAKGRKLQLYDHKDEERFQNKINLLSRKIETEMDEYKSFWEHYSRKRKKELSREDFCLALKKMGKMKLGDLAKEIRWSDVKRNLGRLLNSGK